MAVKITEKISISYVEMTELLRNILIHADRGSSIVNLSKFVKCNFEFVGLYIKHSHCFVVG